MPTSVVAARLLVPALAAVALSCAESPQLRVIGADDEAQAEGRTKTTAAHVHYDSTMDLPSDADVVEPAQPYTATPAERLLTHVHTPAGVCSGMVLGPKLVVTAHQCVGGSLQGVQKASAGFRVEVASSSLTWTVRTPALVAAPACGWEKVDLAVLVLAEPVDWAKPLHPGTAPDPGAKVQALGFGHCGGGDRGIRDKAGSVVSVDSQTLVIDVGLCKGDVGGFVVDSSTSFLGIVSHQDDPDNSPRHTTTIFRTDTAVARNLFAQAEKAAAGEDATKMTPVACE